MFEIDEVPLLIIKHFCNGVITESQEASTSVKQRHLVSE